MAILLFFSASTKNTAPIFEQVLREYNIPVISDSNEGYLDTIEIKTVLSFFRDNRQSTARHTLNCCHEKLLSLALQPMNLPK